ncbi:hypothetical protein AGLY_000706 [Aphis glycines]|uniref:Uncharacterized protein n=1 Tax=Aphis glycines TaxID=307491 RepID=A0A6G0U888_APHGL|nr:hypothetical protein AGLY_000706 [Aphis glycines]
MALRIPIINVAFQRSQFSIFTQAQTLKAAFRYVDPRLPIAPLHCLRNLCTKFQVSRLSSLAWMLMNHPGQSRQSLNFTKLFFFCRAHSIKILTLNKHDNYKFKCYTIPIHKKNFKFEYTGVIIYIFYYINQIPLRYFLNKQSKNSNRCMVIDKLVYSKYYIRNIIHLIFKVKKSGSTLFAYIIELIFVKLWSYTKRVLKNNYMINLLTCRDSISHINTAPFIKNKILMRNIILTYIKMCILIILNAKIVLSVINGIYILE